MIEICVQCKSAFLYKPIHWVYCSYTCANNNDMTLNDRELYKSFSSHWQLTHRVTPIPAFNSWLKHYK